MKIRETPVSGALLFDLTPHRDPRGTFTELMEPAKEFPLFMDRVEMVNMSMSEEEGTIRGMHWQAWPQRQTKLVYSVHGAVFDAIVDVRPKSPTFGRAFWTELLPGMNALYAPPGVAHGWQAISGFATLLYLVDMPYAPNLELGLRYDDPEAAIPWPRPARRVSERDLKWPFLKDLA